VTIIIKIKSKKSDTKYLFFVIIKLKAFNDFSLKIIFSKKIYLMEQDIPYGCGRV